MVAPPVWPRICTGSLRPAFLLAPEWLVSYRPLARKGGTSPKGDRRVRGRRRPVRSGVKPRLPRISQTLESRARQINSSLRRRSAATMGEPQPLDAQSTKLVLIALLRAVSRMKGVLEEPDRAVLKDMVVDEPLRPELLRIGIRMAILDNDPRSGSRRTTRFT